MPANSGNHREYTPEDHWQAATAVLTSTSLKAAATLCGMHYETLRYWVKQDWFNDILTKIKEEHEKAYLASAHSIIMAGTKRALDALQNGETVIDKNGQEKRRPVSAKDAAIIASIWMNHKRVMENKPTSISGSTTSKKLEDQKAMFESMAGVISKSTETKTDEPSVPGLPTPQSIDGREGTGSDSPATSS